MCLDGEALRRADLSDLRGREILLAGLYGDLCVLDAARTLKQRGFEVALLEDACLWSAPLDLLLRPDEADESSCDLPDFRRVRARQLWPEVADYDDDPGLWDGILSL